MGMFLRCGGTGLSFYSRNTPETQRATSILERMKTTSIGQGQLSEIRMVCKYKKLLNLVFDKSRR